MRSRLRRASKDLESAQDRGGGEITMGGREEDGELRSSLRSPFLRLLWSISHRDLLRRILASVLLIPSRKSRKFNWSE